MWLRWSGTIRRPCRLWAFCLNRPRGRGQHCPPLARVNQVSGVRERAGDGQPQRHVKLVNAERKLTPYCRAGTRGSFFTRRRQSSATRQRWPARPHTSGQAAPSPCLHARTPCAAQIRVTGAGTSRRAMEVRRVGFRVAQAPRSGMVPCDQDARGHGPGRSPPEVDLEATTVAAVVGDEGLHGGRSRLSWLTHRSTMTGAPLAMPSSLATWSLARAASTDLRPLEITTPGRSSSTRYSDWSLKSWSTRLGATWRRSPAGTRSRPPTSAS